MASVLLLLSEMRQTLGIWYISYVDFKNAAHQIPYQLVLILMRYATYMDPPGLPSYLPVC